MKIPYKVSMNAAGAFTTSTVMRNSGPEASRLLVAEEFDWDANVTPPPLTYLANLELAKIFHKLNPLQRILQKDVDTLIDMYPQDIPLRHTVPQIKDEHYWKRAYKTRFPGKIQLEPCYWKATYLSAVLQDYLENVNPDVFNEEEAVELATLVAPYIYNLKLNEMQMVFQPKPFIPPAGKIGDMCPWSVKKLYDHLRLEPVLKCLYNLEELVLIFCKRNLQENYLPRYFEFTEADIVSMCRGLVGLPHIKTLRINNSNLDCPKVKLLLQHLVNKETIEELDFNNCKIGDYGMKALGGFIKVHENLKIVRIANNRFKEEGVQGIAYALQMKPAAPLELIDFSLNPMSLECATMFAAAFVRCKEKPQTLIVNSCGFSGPAAEKMAGLLCLNRGLLRLDMAANDLSGDAEDTLIAALEKNRNILIIDLRRTKISDETQAKVDELLLRNKNLIGQDREPSEEIPPLYLNEPEYLVWEYNPNNPDYIPGRYPPRIAEV